MPKDTYNIRLKQCPTAKNQVKSLKFAFIELHLPEVVNLLIGWPKLNFIGIYWRLLGLRKGTFRLVC